MMQWVSLDGITRRIINVEFDNVIKSKCFESSLIYARYIWIKEW